jgi:hypothetical protein
MTRICPPSGCGEDKTGITSAKAVDFADLQGPIAASAYFELASGPMGRQIVWLDECRWNTTICPELFFPQLTLPKMVTKLEPAWASCMEGYYGNYIWDPPMVMDPTSVLRPASITIKTKHNPEETLAAAPGMPISTPNSPPTLFPTPQLTSALQTGLSPLDSIHPLGSLPLGSRPPGSQSDISSVALIKVGADTITASISPDQSNIKIGSHSLHLGDLPLVTAGATFSFGTNGRLEVIQSHRATADRTVPRSTKAPTNHGTGRPSSEALQNGSGNNYGRPDLEEGDDEDETPVLTSTSYKGPRTETFILSHGRKKNQAVSGISRISGLYLALMIMSFNVNL